MLISISNEFSDFELESGVSFNESELKALLGKFLEVVINVAHDKINGKL